MFSLGNDFGDTRTTMLVTLLYTWWHASEVGGTMRSNGQPSCAHASQPNHTTDVAEKGEQKCVRQCAGDLLHRYLNIPPLHAHHTMTATFSAQYSQPQ